MVNSKFFGFKIRASETQNHPRSPEIGPKFSDTHVFWGTILCPDLYMINVSSHVIERWSRFRKRFACGIQNPGLWNPESRYNDWKPESKFHWQGIRNPSPGIQNPSPGIWNPSAVIWNASPGIRNPSPVIWNPSPVIWNPSPGIRNPSPVIWNPSPVRNLESITWNPKSITWNPESITWYPESRA